MKSLKKIHILVPSYLQILTHSRFSSNRHQAVSTNVSYVIIETLCNLLGISVNAWLHPF
jgi:hypothetical protein